jgi:hypothetical protein
MPSVKKPLVVALTGVVVLSVGAGAMASVATRTTSDVKRLASAESRVVSLLNVYKDGRSWKAQFEAAVASQSADLAALNADLKGATTTTTAKTTTTLAKTTALPINSGGLLGGNAKPVFPAGAPGKVDVVGIGPLSTTPAGDSTLPIAVRNNTRAGVSHIDISATARNNTGKLVATGTSQEVDPAQLAPGEVGLSFIYFQIGTPPPPKDATYSFSAQTIPADKSSYNTASLKVTEANLSGGSIVGTGVNKTGKQVQGPYSVNAYCFDAAGHLLSTQGSFADQSGDLAPNASASFTLNLYGTSCPSYLVGITGFFS